MDDCHIANARPDCPLPGDDQPGHCELLHLRVVLGFQRLQAGDPQGPDLLALLTRRMKMADTLPPSPMGTDLPRVSLGGPGLPLPGSKASGHITESIPSIPTQR